MLGCVVDDQEPRAEKLRQAEEEDRNPTLPEDRGREDDPVNGEDNPRSTVLWSVPQPGLLCRVW